MTNEELQEMEVGQVRRMIEEAEAALPYLRRRQTVSYTTTVEDIERLRCLLRKGWTPNPGSV